MRLASGLVLVGVLSGLSVPGAPGLQGVSAASETYPFVVRVVAGDPADHGVGCSGALVDPSWLVTGKACIAGNGGAVPEGRPATATTVTIGRATVPVIDLVPHPDRDVVLIKMAVPAAGVTPVRIATEAPTAGEVLTVAGLGRTADEWVPDAVHAATFSVTAVTSNLLTIAGRDTDQVGPCKGDAGGPGLRTVGGQPALVALTYGGGQGGCLDAPAGATTRGGTQTRVDDLAAWIEQHVDGKPRPTSFLYDNQQHVFARGADGKLHHWKWVTGEGRGYESWGEELAGTPMSYVYGKQQHVLGRGADGKLHHWIWEPGKARSHSIWAEGLAGDPAGYATDNAQHIYARGTDGKLHHWSWTQGVGYAHEVIGDGISGDPAAYVLGTQHHVWARGTDGKLTHWVWEPGKAPRRETWDGGLAGDPVAFVYGDQQHVFGRGTDGQLHHWKWTPGEGRGHETWGGSLAGDPTGYATADAQHIYARGTDGQLHHWSWTRGVGRATEVLGDGIAGDPTSYVLGTQHHVWARGTDAKLNHWVWETGKPTRRETWEGTTL
ncbi:hypothetical protein KRMM14A1004_57550 [Krasilnikovia sp. MM14-A1004]